MNLTQCIKGGSSDKRSGFIISFGYDVDTIETLKSSVPHTFREWHEDTKTWWVSQEYESVLNTLFKNFDALIHLQGSLF